MCFYTSSFCLMGLVDFLLPDVLPFFVFRVHSLHRSSFRLMDASAEAGKQHHRNSINDVGTKGESSKKIKPTKLPQRGPGIAMLEMFRIEEEKKKKDAAAASCSEPSAASSSKFCDASIFCQPSVFALVVHSAHPPPNPFTHFLGLNDSSSLVRPNHKIVALHRPEFNSSKDLLMWSSLQSCSSSIPAVQLPLHPLVIKNLSQPSMSGPGFEVEMEPPSIQIYPGSMNRSFIAEEQRIIGHKRSQPFLTESFQPDFDSKLMNGMEPKRKLIALQRDSALSSSNLGDHRVCHCPQTLLNAAPEEEEEEEEEQDVGTLDGSFLSLGRTPATSRCARPKQALSNHQTPVIDLTLSETQIEGSAGSTNSEAATASGRLNFYNFMGSHDDYIANQTGRGCLNAADLEFKL